VTFLGQRFQPPQALVAKASSGDFALAFSAGLDAYQSCSMLAVAVSMAKAIEEASEGTRIATG
jgi:hypothetical protein